LFVAGFIGSPSMNFISGRIAEEEGGLRFITTGVNAVIPRSKAKTLREKGYIGQEMILGIRPEDIHGEADFLEGRPESTVDAFIEVTENLGHEMYLYLRGIGDSTKRGERLCPPSGLGPTTPFCMRCNKSGRYSHPSNRYQGFTRTSVAGDYIPR